jgi:hypothetical protein
MPNPGLGRKYQPDDRDVIIWKTPLRIDPETVTKTYQYWPMGGISQRLDQGQTGHCVGFGTTSYFFTGPVVHPDISFTDDYAHALYYDCKIIDGEPGAEDGTYVRTGMKVGVNRGLIQSYAFASDIDSVVLNVLERGPVTIGVSWYNSMFDPDSNYFIHVKRSSGLAGGHCLTVTGVNTVQRKARLLNSWGTSWGRNGFCFISLDDLATLLSEQGEMALAVELP